MSEYSAKTLREKAKAKARALANPGNYAKDQEVSSADWSPAPPLRTEMKTGARPIMKPSSKGTGESYAARDTKAAIGKDMKRGAFKAGGAVKRKDGGSVPSAAETEDTKARLGSMKIKPVRGAAQHYKKGGKIKKAGGGTLDDSRYGALQKVLGPSNVGNRKIADFRQAADIARGMGPSSSENEPMPAEGSLYKKGGKIKRAAGGKIKKAGGGSFLEKMVGGSEREKQARSMRDVGKSGTANYTQEDKGALNRALRGDDALPAAGEAAERSGKYQNYKKGGRTAKATGGGLFGALKGAAKKVSKKGGKTDINIVINAGKSEPRHSEAAMRRPAPDMVPPPPPMDVGAAAPAMPPMGPPGAGPMLPPGLPIGRKAGGRITKVAKSYKDMQAGSGSGEGRLQKTDIAKLHKDAPARKAGGRISRVAKSYKDMTAGAASGEGRLQKEDIAKAKKGRGR